METGAWQHSTLFDEYEAAATFAMSYGQFKQQERDEQARMVAFIRARNIMNSVSQWEAAGKARLKAKSKGK